MLTIIVIIIIIESNSSQVFKNVVNMHKSSRQRDGISALLTKKNYHPTVDDLYLKIKKDFPNISLGTVYRNLDQLTQMGKIIKIDIPDKPARYDGNTEDHYHVRCVNCGFIEDVWMDFDLRDCVDLNKAIPNFDVLEYDIGFLGVCEKCKK